MPDGQTTRRDPIQAMLANVQFMRANGYSQRDIDDELKRWRPKIAAYNAAEQEQAAREEKLGSVVTRAATALGQPLRALPGGEALMAGARAVARRQPYSEALEDIQTAQESVNPIAAGVTRAATGMAALGPVLGRIKPAKTALAGAAQAAKTGAAVAATERALAAEPESLAERAAGTALAGTVGAVAGAGTQALARGAMAGRDIARSLRVPTRGAQQLAAEQALTTQTKPMYAAAEAAGRVTQGPSQALGTPGIREYVDDILSSPSFREKYPNPSQQDVIKAVREHILDTQKAAEKAAMGQVGTGTQRVQAATRLKKEDAQVLARQLLDESDYFTQGAYRQAVTTTARGKGLQRAAQRGAEGVKTAATRPWISGEKLSTKSLEAITKDISKMSPDELGAALPAGYAGLRESIQLNYSPLAGFGVPQAITRALRARPAIQALEQATAATRPPSLERSLKFSATPKSIRDYLLAGGIGL